MQNMDKTPFQEVIELWKKVRLVSNKESSPSISDACFEKQCTENSEGHSMKGGHSMTYMQSLYAQNVENARSHRAQEGLKAAEIDETIRSHKVNEALSEKDLEEKIRHQITQDTETMRHNLASENEIAIHNRNTEAISRAANEVARLGHELNYAAQHERTVAERDIAELNNATKLYLDSWQNRINEAKSKAERQSATAKLMEAKAKIDAAQASLQNAATNAERAGYQNYADIGRGTRDLVTAVATTSDTIQDWIPGAGKQTVGANVANNKNVSKTATRVGKQNARKSIDEIQSDLGDTIERRATYGRK